jgi:crotonobetainyl-CoA:carnitine CoA-transferase CaiB-like acyl-CoA transferase
MVNEVRQEGPLSGYRVLEIGDLRTALGCRLLADLGAEVIRIEPPGGSPDRHLAPFAGDRPGPERSFVFLARNAGKRSVLLDLANDADRSDLLQLVASADAMVAATAPGEMERLGLGWEDLRAVNPILVACFVTEFGLSGPRASWKGDEIVAFAMSGAMQVAGSPGRPPCNAPGQMAYDSASVYAALGVMIALYNRRRSGRGRFIEVSVQEAAASALYPWAVPTFNYSGAIMARGGTAFTLYPCADGRVRIMLAGDRQWDAMRDILGNPSELADIAFANRQFRAANQDLVRELVARHTRKWRAEELCAVARKRGIAISVVRPPSGFASDPNVVARGFFEQVEHPELGRITLPGAAIKLSGVVRAACPRPPVLGEDTLDVMGDLEQ